MQTAMCENTKDQPMAEFHPFGIKSGPPDDPSYDPTCFWFPNPACCIAMLEYVGFKEVKCIHHPLQWEDFSALWRDCKRKANLRLKAQLRGRRMCNAIVWPWCIRRCRWLGSSTSQPTPQSVAGMRYNSVIYVSADIEELPFRIRGRSGKHEARPPLNFL